MRINDHHYHIENVELLDHGMNGAVIHLRTGSGNEPGSSRYIPRIVFTPAEATKLAEDLGEFLYEDQDPRSMGWVGDDGLP